MPTQLIDTAVDRRQSQEARDVVAALFLLLKTARVYETNNDSYRTQAERFQSCLRNYLDDRASCTVKLVRERFFVDDHFLTITSDDKIGILSVMDRWQELQLGGLFFGDTVAPNQIDAFVDLFWKFVLPPDQPFERLTEQLAETGVDSISLLARQVYEDDQKISMEGRQRVRLQARETFFRSIGIVKEIISSASQQEKISVARTRRVVHSIIDQISEDESALVELASIKDFDEYTYAHCVNVCIYALTLGFRLGLGRRELSHLGFAALFHDIGKVRLPFDLVNKPARFDEFDWEQMHKHPLYGAMAIARSFRLDPHTSRAMVVAFEHHINPDFTGYPVRPEPRPTNLYSRIVSIADSFDALSSGRVYIKEAIPSDEVLRILMYQMTAKFDAVLMKTFVNIIGIYPIGSLVLLSDGNLGLVTRTNRADLRRPEVRIIADRSGERPESLWLNLSHPDNVAVTIVRLIDPIKYNLDVTRFILSDN